MSDLSGNAWQIPPWIPIYAAALFENGSVAFNVVSQTVRRVGWGVWRSLTPLQYVFFENSFHPYPKPDLQLGHPISPPVAWYYTPAQKVFQQPMSTRHWRHLSWLSAQIQHGEDLVVQDITDFVNTLHWIGEQPPTPELILAAWTLETGIVLNPALPLRITVITEEGTEETFRLYEEHVSPAATGETTTPTTNPPTEG